MRSLSREEFESEFIICERLDADRPRGTYLARKDASLSVILKETDEKRTAVYEALTGLWNPHLADTYEVLQVSGGGAVRYYAVTEHVRAGERSLSLAEFVRENGPLSERTALEIGVQLCEGLRDFHRRGFVHRDLKPDNIMISERDVRNPQIKIVDFGGAKRNDRLGISDTTVVGTRGYQAPEGLATVTTERADIYSIGCVLTFLLTGQEPGRGTYRGSHYVVNMLERAANEDASQRYETVTVLQKELEHLLGRRPIDRIPFIRALPGFRSHTPWKTVFAGMAYAYLLEAGAFYYMNFTLREALVTGVSWVLAPLILIFNMGNLLRFFPENLRKNNRLFFKIRAAILFVVLCEPVIISYAITNLGWKI